MSVSDFVGYGASIFMGFVLGLTGGGGAILTIPILVYLFGLKAWEATTHSLFIVGLSALSGAVVALRKRELNIAKTLKFGGPSIFGVFMVRAFLMPSFPEKILFLDFSIDKSQVVLFSFIIIMLLASLSMIKKKKTIVEVQNDSKGSRLVLQGFFTGAVTGFVGAGGGFLIIPALVNFIGMPMKEAVASSFVIITLQSLVGVLSSYSMWSHLDFVLIGGITLLAYIGVYLGSQMRSKISQDSLKKIFGYFVLTMAAFILYKELLLIKN